jgi:hypothetical protein
MRAMCPGIRKIDPSAWIGNGARAGQFVWVCTEFNARHAEVSVELEQSGGRPPVVALSVDAPSAAHTTGVTRLSVTQVSDRGTP